MQKKTQKTTNQQPEEKGMLKNVRSLSFQSGFLSYYFSCLCWKKTPSESLAGLLSAKVSPCGLMYRYHGGDRYHNDCETSFTCKAVASCTNELHICPLKHDGAEELTSKWLGICIMLYGSKAGIKKQESPASAAALALLSVTFEPPSLLPGESPAHGAGGSCWV